MEGRPAEIVLDRVTDEPQKLIVAVKETVPSTILVSVVWEPVVINWQVEWFFHIDGFS